MGRTMAFLRVWTSPDDWEYVQSGRSTDIVLGIFDGVERSARREVFLAQYKGLWGSGNYPTLETLIVRQDSYVFVTRS